MTSSHFPLPINGEWSHDETTFTLDTPFVYIDEEKGIEVIVPAGFTTDFQSIPRALQGWFPKTQYLKAGLIHDWLYKSPSGFQSTIYTPPLTREQCDDIWRRILDLQGCRWTKRQLGWAGLRAGGGAAWNRHRKADAPQG